jgi:hypothetical protein
MKKSDLDDVVHAFEKVVKHIDELKINVPVAG